MKRRILAMIMVGSIFLMALTGCGGSSGKRKGSDGATGSNKNTTAGAERSDGSEAQTDQEGSGLENPVAGGAGLYQPDGSFIPWDDLGIEVETDYDTRDEFNAAKNTPAKVFSNKNYKGELVLPDTLEHIGTAAFYECTSLTDIVLPDTLTSMGGAAFYGCSSLKSIDLSHTQITRIENGTFNGCSSLTSVNLSNTQITRILDNAFDDCSSLTDIDLSNSSLTRIDANAFDGCTSLTSIDLSNTPLTRIGPWAFSGCTSLTSITLPDTLIVMQRKIFSECTSLTNIDYAGTRDEWRAIAKKDTFGDWDEESSVKKIICSDGSLNP